MESKRKEIQRKKRDSAAERPYSSAGGSPGHGTQPSTSKMGSGVGLGGGGQDQGLGQG